MLAIIEFDWKVSEIVKKLARADYLRLRDAIPQLNLYDWPEGKDEPTAVYMTGTPLIDLSTDGFILTELAIPFTVKRFKGTYRAGSAPMPDRPGASYTLHVAIPAIGLLMVDEVEAVENPCTDALQGYLKEGWRIIAVCPPDAQRRPDYILGRSPEMRATHGGGR